jgi:magnesium-dependent phosphatase-1
MHSSYECYLTIIEEALRKAKPSCVVFDADMTIWNGNASDYMAAVLGPDKAKDLTSGKELHLFPDVRRIFWLLARNSIPIAVASTSRCGTVVEDIVKAFDLHVDYMQVRRTEEEHRGQKDMQLKAISTELDAPLDKMIFFDDLTHNIRKAKQIGVGVAVLVDNGVQMSHLHTACICLASR